MLGVYTPAGSFSKPSDEYIVQSSNEPQANKRWPPVDSSCKAYFTVRFSMVKTWIFVDEI